MDYSKMPLLDFIDKIWEGSDITNIEIYNYFEKITGNFDKEKIKISLNDIDCYYTLTLRDDILNESIDIYTKNGWEIPYIDMTNLLDEILLSNNKKANNKKILVHDSKTMLNETHFAKGYSCLHYAMNLLKRKLNEYEQETPPTSTNDASNINWHPKIFETQQDFELFELLQPKVIDKLADYSYFYRIMVKENKIHAKPTPFANWLNKTYEIDDLIPKVKTLAECKTEAKKQIYETIKLFYKTKNNH